MDKNKELYVIESSIFDITQCLLEAKQYKNLNDYRLGLSILDQLNLEYYEISGSYFLDQNKMLDFHSKQWEMVK